MPDWGAGPSQPECWVGVLLSRRHHDQTLCRSVETLKRRQGELVGADQGEDREHR
jgi:hypothetical protein